jgi:hypothetical protein
MARWRGSITPWCKAAKYAGFTSITVLISAESIMQFARLSLSAHAMLAIRGKHGGDPQLGGELE